MLKYADHGRTTIVVMKARNGVPKHVVFKSFAGTVEHDEKMPSFHEPGWALWCAFRLLHPTMLHSFETEVRAMFEEYKRGEKQWITFNEEKRVLLERYLRAPYYPKKAKRK